jgi:hypothetical protein
MKPNVQWEASCTSPLSTALLVFFANEKSPKNSVLKKKIAIREKKVLENMLENSLPIANSQFISRCQ